MGFRRIISFITAAVMSIGTLTVPVTADAEETADTGQIMDETEIRGGNSLSDMILGTIGDEGEADSSPNRVSKVVIEDGKAVVSYHTEVGCDLVVAFYSDDGKKMYSSVKQAVTPVYDEGAEYEQTCTLDMPDDVPEYFLVKAYLIGLGYAPISKEYSTNYYTESIMDVRNATPDDYDQELVVRLDEASDNSFLVLQEDTVTVEYDGIHNIKDEEKSDGNTYCFTNADEQPTALKKGDVVCYKLPDEILAFTVESITVSGTDVKIVAADDMKLSDAFSVYRIQETMQGTPDAEIGETYGEGVTYLGPETNETPAAIDPYSGRVLSKAESEPVEIPVAYTFTWKNDSLICQNDNQAQDEQEKKDQWDRTKYLGKGYGNGKFYGSAKGYVDVKVKVSSTLTVELLGSDNGQDYSSLITDLSGKLSGSIGIEAEGKLLLVGMTFSKSCFVALIGVGFKFSGKTELKCDGITFTEKAEAVLYRRGLIPQGLFVSHYYDVNFASLEIKKEVEGFIGLYAGVEAYILIGGDKIGFDLEGYGGVKLKSTLFSTHVDENAFSRHICDECYQGTLYFNADLKASAGLGEMFGGKLKLSTSLSDILDRDNDAKLTDYYFSRTYGDFGLTTCPHQDYRIDIYVTENGKPVQGAEVTVTGEDSKTQTLVTDKDGVIKDYWPDGYYTIQCALGEETENRSVSHYGRRNTVEFNYKKSGDKYYRVDPDDPAGQDDPADPDSPEAQESLEYLKWEENEDGGITITDCDKSAVRIMIPRKIDGKPVTRIRGFAFSDCSSLTDITIPDGVTSIGEEAFAGCSSLSDIIIPDSVTNIGRYAFAKCWSLTNIIIPNGVTSIEYGTFYNFEKLTDITIPDGVTSIEGYAFAGCSSLSDIIIPDSVTNIGRYAFASCYSLSDIIIPDSVTGIGRQAFFLCSSPTDITIPDGVTSIGEAVFGGCSSLSDIIIPDSVTNIGQSAFNGCTNLTNITIPDSVAGIGRQAFFRCSSLTDITIPDGVTSIGEAVFAECEKLKSITILNPDCEIFDSNYTIYNGYDNETHSYFFNGTVYGYENSTAQAYAEKYGYIFEPIGAEPSEVHTSNHMNAIVAAPAVIPTVTFMSAPKTAEETADVECTFTQEVTEADIYNFYVFADENVADLLADGNLLYITQVQVTPDNLTAEIPYILGSDYPDKAERLVRFKAPEQSGGEESDPQATTPATTTAETPGTTTTTAAETKPETSTTTAATAKQTTATKPATTAASTTKSSIARPTTTTVAASATKPATTTVTTIRTTVSKAVSTTVVSSTTAANGSATETTDTSGSGQETQTTALGDVNSDGIVDSSDASEVLMIYAMVSTGGGELSEEQKAVADINSDGLVDSADASLILEYYAYVSTGGTDTADVYFSKEKEIA